MLWEEDQFPLGSMGNYCVLDHERGLRDGNMIYLGYARRAIIPRPGSILNILLVNNVC